MGLNMRSELTTETTFGTAVPAPALALVAALVFVLAVPASSPAAVGASEIERQVARLDTLHSVRDPLIKEIASLGDGAIPAVVANVTSDRRMTALGASWVLTHMGSEKAFRPLLETWVGTVPGKAREQVERAVHMVLRRRTEYAVVPVVGTVEEKLVLLARSVLCQAGGLPDGCEVDPGDRDAPPLLVCGEGLSDVYDLACGERAVQVLPSEAFRESTYLVGRAFVRLDLAVHDLPRSAPSMPRWVATRGARPDRLALVRIACGRVGPEHPTNEYGVLWVLSAGSWSPLFELFRMSVN